ncbi:sushi, von Willebrand factor type A, EGF and pentraxin domain-containing protein 1-like [Diadema antillarum]|uniref:sushi, von Willebrand factor type A, EGF and pentraxin domain-containing protein 1-like n=1 Tax=Diadema antillarum TaxID=105358 RepID=UPI003A8370B4
MRKGGLVFAVSYLCHLLITSCGGQSTTSNAKTLSVKANKFKKQIETTFGSATESNLVFLLDSSRSVNLTHYRQAIEFVRLTSTLLSVSANTTRISVISYSDCKSIYTYIDYISAPGTKNKCTLDTDLDDVRYTPGATCTGDALETAGTVLRAGHGRPNAQGVIILLTDGVSNDGKRPGPVADQLKGRGVVIFSIGLGTTVSSFELESIATSYEYVFWLADFGDINSFGSAVKQDVKDNNAVYEQVDVAKCYNNDTTQCDGLGNCCGQNAACSCATRSGSIACTCEPGYTGDGFSCKVCQQGTYKSSYGNHPCTPCPAHSSTVSTASTDSMDCECDLGYVENTGMNGSSCHPVECTAFNITINDTSIMMIPADCQNTFDSTCTFQCKQGYRIVGADTSSRCLETGDWSATPPTCEKVACSDLPEPEDGESDCDTNDNSIGTVCTLRCDEGYQLEASGVNTTTCREMVPPTTAEWDSQLGACQKISCPGLTVTSPMTIRPVVCQSSPKYDQDCSYGCQTGYTLNCTGEAFINTTCLANGTWSSIPPMSCEDNLPPEVRCPSSINDTTDDLMPTREVNWTVPVPTDNSGIRPDLVGSHNPPHHFHIGLTVVTYVATDTAGLTSQCNFTVEITDQENPRVQNCSDDINEQTALPTVNVTWNDPVFEDNSGNVTITPPENASGSAFPIGEHEIIYTATDPSQNKETCEFTVSVTEYSCQHFPPPLNGAVACTQQLGGQICKMFCNRKYRFVELPERYYNCSQGSWLAASTGTPAQMPWPDCSQSRAKTAEVRLSVQFYRGKCKRASLDIITEKFGEYFHDLLSELGTINTSCGPHVVCDFGDLNITCGQHNRRRRQANTDDILTLTFTSSVTSNTNFANVDEDAPTELPNLDNRAALDSLVSSIQDLVTSGNFTVTLDDVPLLPAVETFTVGEYYSVPCDPGLVSSNDSCCKTRIFFYYFYKQGTSDTCERCPEGTYQGEYGRTECLSCPEGTSTAAAGSRTAKKCKAVCQPGTFSRTGIKSCTACPKGSYQPHRGSTSCMACPDGLTTWTVGASSMDHCTDICPRGSTSLTGFAPCTPCPRGSYQPASQQTECIPCPDGTFTHKAGAHAIQYCQVINECDFNGRNPCLNEATCEDLPQGYHCACLPGYTGQNCEVNIDECYNNDACLNGGTCLDLVNGYQCSCPTGFHGVNCQNDADDCLGADCRFGGTCVDGIDSYTCRCQDGFTGEHCQINLFDCASDPCQNGASCIDLKSNFMCCCPLGYTGRYCELIKDYCVSSPCYGNATCSSSNTGYACACPPGFEGHNCDVNIDECHTRNVTCENGGICIDAINDYHCICPLGFDGVHCQTVLSSDYDLHFDTVRTVNRAELEGVLPDLFEFTLAFWMRTSDRVNFGTPISYAVRGAEGEEDVDNALTLQDYNNFVLSVNGESVATYVSANQDDRWYFITVTWSNHKGAWSLYLDGRLETSGKRLSSKRPIRGRGMFVVGQEQDSYNGSYVPKESFLGAITQVNMWDYAMDLDEILNLNASCSSTGNVLSWAQLSTGINGEVRVQSPSRQCSALDDCAAAPDYCRNGGTCVDSHDGISCKCPPGTYGPTCENLAIPCLPDNQCLNGGSYMDECLADNGGCEHSCKNTAGSFQCSCREGYALQDDGKTCIEGSSMGFWLRFVCLPEWTGSVYPEGMSIHKLFPELNTCSVDSRGLFITFDGYSFRKMGNCRYILTQDCSGVANFEVHVEHRQDSHDVATYQPVVFIYIDCVEVKIDADGTVYVFGEHVTLPYLHDSPQTVQINSRGPSDILVATNKGMFVEWSSERGVSVHLSSQHSSKACGLCGNMNGNPEDDTLTRQLITSQTTRELLHSWKIGGYKYCRPVENRPQQNALKFGRISAEACGLMNYLDFRRAREKCGVFRHERFAVCHERVDPTPYLALCIEDACTCGVTEPCHCEAISAYANECERNGVTIEDWSAMTACHLTCPPTMIYDDYGPPCRPTCGDPQGTSCPFSSSQYVAGCQCPAGRVLNNCQCITTDECRELNGE